MAKMKSVQVPEAGADFEVVEREIPEPGSGHVRISVLSCEVCHSDVITASPPACRTRAAGGHEVAGVIDAIGPG